MTSSQADVTAAAPGPQCRPAFLVPVEDRPSPKRRGSGLAWMLQLACGLQLAVMAAFAVTVISGAWQLPAVPALTLFAFGAGQTKLTHFRNRRFRTSWEPFDIDRHPNTARFFDGLCDRYGISNIRLVQRSRHVGDSEVGIAAVTIVGQTPYIILNPVALAWAGDDSLYLRKVLSHELTHVLRGHPTVRPAFTQLMLTAPATVLTAGLAVFVTSGSPGTWTTLLGCAMAAFGLAVTGGWQPRMYRPFLSWLRMRCEAEAERGTVGLCGPANTVLVAVQSVASDINPSIEGGFDRPAGGAYFSDADFLFEATGDRRWQDPTSDAWAYVRDRFLIPGDPQVDL